MRCKENILKCHKLQKTRHHQ